MSSDFRDRRRIASAWALSITGHAALVAVGALLVASSLAERDAPVPLAHNALNEEVPVDIELPLMIDASLASRAFGEDTRPTDLPRGGGEGLPRPDTGEHGRGGTDTAQAPAINLADRDDGTMLSPD